MPQCRCDRQRQLGWSGSRFMWVLGIRPTSQACTLPAEPALWPFSYFFRDNAPFPFAAVERGSHWFFCFSFVFQFEVLFGSSLYILISLLKLSISLLWLLSCFKHIHDFSWKDFYYDCFKNLCQAVLAPASCWHCCLSLSELVETRSALVLSLRVHPPCLWSTGSLASLRLSH